jgi:OPA family glycerol-3-phosphate transporter-like MFS transporter/OPA family sugar phosphate sensor protein UhpC-like MFS transporter
MFGYIFFYFIRKNLSMAMPLLESDLGIGKQELGLFLTLHGLLYGFSRFVNGIIADRVNPRWFMAAGLFLCALANFGFGMSNAVWLMGIFWILNGWFQGMGFPPCAKSLTHWFAAEERGVKFSIWNTSHSIGAGLVFLLNAGIILLFHDWRYCFFIPGTIAVFGAFFLLERLRDSPESMGLDPVENYYAKKHGQISEQKNDEISDEKTDEKQNEKSEPIQEGLGRTLYKHVYSNPAIWFISLANFFVYIVRFSILDWAPTFLKQAKGIDIAQAGVVSSCYELIGVIGMLCGGLLMDRIFRGRGSKVCFLYMLGCTITMGFFWWTNSSSVWVNALFLAVLGFFIYGPQCLIGVIAANVATKKAAAAANGLTGIFGYMSVIVTGWGVGFVAEKYDWNAVFLCLIGASFIAMLLFCFVLNAAAPEQQNKT